MFRNFVYSILSLAVLVGIIDRDEALAETLYLKVRSTKLRVEASHLGKSIGALGYGDSLEKVGEEKGWYKVKTKNNKIGFIHSSALSEKRIALSGTANKAGSAAADSSEVVLAGKGFNSTVEKEYALVNKGLNFKAVDKMEKLNVNEGDLAAFIKEGRLKREG